MAGFNPIIYGRFWVITEGWNQEHKILSPALHQLQI